MQLSIVTKLSLLVAGAVAFTAFTVNEIYTRRSTALLIEDHVNDIAEQSNFFVYPLQEKIAALKDDMHALARMQAISRLPASAGTAAVNVAHHALEEVLHTSEYYRRISLVRLSDGIPVVEIEHENNRNQHVAGALGQTDQSELRQSLQQEADADVHLSHVALARTQDGIAEPRALVMQAAAKSGFYLISLEIDMGSIISDIGRHFNNSETYHVTDEYGNYVFHPERSRLYAGDLGHGFTAVAEHPEIAASLRNSETQAYTHIPADHKNGDVVTLRKFPYDSHDASHFLAIIVTAPYRTIAQQVSGITHESISWISGIVLLSMLVSVLLLRILMRPLKVIAANILLYRQGKKDIRLPTASPDEIGVLAKEFSAMIAQKNEEEWIREHQAAITKQMLGHKQLEHFAASLMGAVTPVIGAELGVLYVSSDYRPHELREEAETLSLLAAYGYMNRTNYPASFAIGEGLVGQCAQSKTMRLVSDLPNDYLRISSALGEGKPKQALYVPILFESRLAGVMEFCTFGEFHAHQFALLEQLCFNAGVILHGIHASERTEDLLEEARMTTEELQRSEEEMKIQAEELQSTNEELEEKSKALEEQNQQILAQSAELEESARLIEEKAAELERANRYKSEFLANMSHELRTPLNSLLILSRSLASNEEGNLTKEQTEEASVIYSGGQELLSLINDILDLSKVEAGKISVQREHTPLDGIVRRIRQQFSPVASEKSVVFDIVLAEGLPPTIYTDAQRVEQILKNLLSNAFKFTKKGSVTLEVSHGAGRLCFTVADTGIGIDASRFKDIFEAFQQEDGSIDRHYGGTGLGLTIARKFAFLLGGEITVESTKGIGSIFRLFLPCTENKSVQPATSISSALPSPSLSQQLTSGSDKTVLIIEDDRNFALTLMKMAQKRGYHCLVAENGRNGLLMAQTHPVSAVILDLRLPDIDGMEVLHQLKHDLKTRHIPVHVITAHADDETASPLSQGAVGFLTKPLSPADVDDMFERVESITLSKVKKLLIVEDDEKTRKALQSLLRKNDLDMRIASNGGEGLVMLKEDSFDCVILDLQLPDMTGFSWLLRMEETCAEGACPPVIIYTARELSEEEHRSLRAYTGSIVVKGTHASERLLDEVTLFLHSVESSLSEEQQQIIRMQHDPDIMLRNRRVLLVDDDMRNIFALTKTLKKHGLAIIIADNGQMALEKLSTEPGIELIIMDIMMPVMDGYEAMRHIREDRRLGDIPIIALTARAMPEEQEKCIAAGANDYLTKPVDIDRLLALIRVWLFNRKQAA